MTNARSAFRVLYVVVYLLLSVHSAQSQPAAQYAPWAKALGYLTHETFRIERDEFGGPVVRMVIHETEVDATFDTGNMTGLAVSNSLVHRLGLSAEGVTKVYRSDGTTIEKARTLKVRSLEAFDSVWHDQTAFQDARMKQPALIGPRFLQDRRFSIDLAGQHMAVSSRKWTPDSTRLSLFPLVISSRHPLLILVKGTVNGTPVLIEIDTGKSRTCVDPELAAELELPTETDGCKIESITLGNRTFSVPSAKIVSFSGISVGLDEPIMLSIGADLLSQFVMTVDYKAGLFAIGP